MKAAALFELEEPVFNFPQPTTPSTEVEIRLLLPANCLPKLMATFGFSGDSAIKSEAWFYDTPELMLHKNGIVLRTKQSTDGCRESSIKLLGTEIPEHPKTVNFEYHIDWNGKQQFNWYSFTSKVDLPANQESDIKKESIESLFTEEQRAIAGRYATEATGNIAWNNLRRFGSVQICSWKDLPALRIGRKITVEHCKIRSRWRKAELLEVSTKAKSLTLRQAADLANDFYQLLAMQGFSGAPGAALKVAKILQFFRPGV